MANSGSTTVSAISTAANTVAATVTVGTSPYGVAVTPDGRDVYVANSGSNTVSVVSTSTNTVAAAVAVGTAPRGVAVTPIPVLPSVTSITPVSGSLAGGTVVAVVGTGLVVGSTTALFGTTAGTSVSCSSTTSCSATSPSESAGTVDLTVTTPDGTSPTGTSDRFTFGPPPAIATVNPATGLEAGGTDVTITGSGFTNATGVTFGGTAAISYTVADDSTIAATTPVGTGEVEVVVTTPFGDSGHSGARDFTYGTAPVIATVDPATGLEAGGTDVTITGSGFTDATGVTFGGTAATGYTVTDDGTIAATTSSGTGEVDVVVTTPFGDSGGSGAGDFTYGPPPVVATVDPATGPETGGTDVTITGSGFTDATGVTFGGDAATSYTVTDDGTIAATAPSGSGEVDVVVTTSFGDSGHSGAGDFTFGPPPVVATVDPATGLEAGGTDVTITGSGFADATGVTFGGTAATGYTVTDDGTIAATTPVGTGVVDVVVTTPFGDSGGSGAGDFTYGTAPVVATVDPMEGPLTGGTDVTITGSGFTNVTGVTFGGDAATSYSEINPSTLVATSPSGPSGSVDVVVTAAVGSSTAGASDHFTYDPVPSVTSITPTEGPAAGGTAVTVTGTGFTSRSTVTFGAGSATSVSVANDTSLVATSPVGPVGSVTVSVTTPGGTSVSSGAGGFTYEADVPGGTTGYRQVAGDGGIFSFGDAGFYGSTGGTQLNRPVVGMASTPTGHGYWLVASDGGIFSFGDAGFYGSTGGTQLNRPVVGMASTPTGHGYWLVASDGGIFSFGDAGFYGSTGGTQLNRPIVGMASTPTGHGYWLVASDGGIFSFGDAGFYGSTGGTQLNRPIVGMASTPTGHGYWLVASDGGIFSFGDAGFYGSTGGTQLNRPVVGMASTPTGHGYWLVASDGGIFSFGDAGFYGSTGGTQLNRPVVGMS